MTVRRNLKGSAGALLVAAFLLCEPAAATAANGYVAADHFQRVVSNGWGSATPGGAYVVQGSASDYWVSNLSYVRGLGYMRVPKPGVARGALLPRAYATNVELRFSAYATAVPGDGPYYIYAVARSSGASEVRARLVFNPDCTVSTTGSIVLDGREQALGSPVTVPNARWCGTGSTGRVVSLRAEIRGTNPTTVRIKAWPANGTTEPSRWLWTRTTTSSPLPARPIVGLRAYVSSGASDRSVDFVFYNWTARAL